MRSLAAAVVVAAPFLIGASLGPDGPDRDVVWKFADERINEGSGLVVTDDRVITVNDSGDSARVFTVELATGRTRGVTTWPADVRDVEALAPAGDGEVWVADIGDNLHRRDDLTVTRVSVGDGDLTATATSYPLSWGTPHDAETLLVHPVTGRLYVVSKEVFGGSVFAAPRQLDPAGPNRLKRIGDGMALATDGAFFPDGRHLILRGYSQATVLTFPELKTVDTFSLPGQRQGEGIAVAPDGRVYVSSEGRHSPLLRVALPAEVRRAVAAPSEKPSGAPSTGTGGSGSQPSDSGDRQQPGGDQTRSPEDEARDRALRWALAAVLGLGLVAVTLRALRPR